ncbi:hypothetical protein ABIB94_008626 [Bradyrhizobium sp. JR7.2]
MLIKGFAVSAALLAFAPDAAAGEPQLGVFRRASCTVIRYYVAKLRSKTVSTPRFAV